MRALFNSETVALTIVSEPIVTNGSSSDFRNLYREVSGPPREAFRLSRTKR
jgi:hypothetical protein